MCRDCQHWRRRAAYEEYGIRWAPCALKPDHVVVDRRVPGGKESVGYVTDAIYTCSRFEAAKGDGQ